MRKAGNSNVNHYHIAFLWKMIPKYFKPKGLTKPHIGANIFAGFSQMADIIIKTDDVVTATKAAKRLGVHFATIYRWVDAGKILGVKLGGVLFIPVSEVDRKRNEKERP